MSRHRRFEVTTPGGADIRICGDPNMSPETLAALMRLADLVFHSGPTPPEPHAFRADGWPLCPICEEDELWSPLIWDGEGEQPSVAAYIAAGLRCYRCGYALPATKEERDV